MAGGPDHAQVEAGGYERRRRVWVVVGVAIAIAFLTLVVVSARRAAVPVGASGGMAGMPMRDARSGSMRMSMRDVGGGLVRIPNGRPGVAVLVGVRDCAACVGAVRAAARAVERARRPADLTVISADSATSRGDIATFAAAAGRPRARYVIDDRTGSLTTMFDLSLLGGAVVYDARGRLISRAASARQIRTILARTAG